MNATWLPQSQSFIGKHISALPTPAFLVSLPKVRKNCLDLINKCKQTNLKLRPHVKTHKTIEGALLQTGGIRSGLVVSTVQELAFFAENNFDDIILARPLTADILERCRPIRKALQKVHFLINSEQSAKEAELEAEKFASDKKPLSVFLKIDAGYHRAGIPWTDTERILSISKHLAHCQHIQLTGLYAHCGNSYTTDGLEAVEQIRDHSVSRVLAVKKILENEDITIKDVGIGSTPSCSLPFPKSMCQLTEIHPGNYIFYDNQQISYGSCKPEDVAVRVMTRVVAHQQYESNVSQIIVDLGFTGLTKQGLDLACPGYASIVGHPDLKLSAMTQELGKIEKVDGSSIDFRKYPIGSTFYLTPYHACATAGMYPHYYVHDENECVCEIWKPTRGW